MTKVISLELAKRLAPYLENVETEYYVSSNPKYSLLGSSDLKYLKSQFSSLKTDFYKTLTLSEIPKFISDCSNEKGRIYCSLLLQKELRDTFSVLEIFNIEMGEKMLTYLLDNNLLWQKN